jgi:hypothetical protein
MPKAAPLKLNAAKHKGGRPSKKTPATLERALAAAREGLPSRFCAGLAGISYQTLNEYRKADPDFAQRYETALSEGVQAKFRKILEAGNRDTPSGWQALAWALERGFCSEFSRPEIQLHALTVNQSTVNNTLTITAEQADDLGTRSRAIEAQLADLKPPAERRAAVERSLVGETNSSPVREIETLVQVGPITLPGAPTASWWKALSRGSEQRQISVEAAEFVLRTIVKEVFGQSGTRLEIDFGSGDLPALSELWGAIADLTGAAGWAVLVKKGEP